MPRYESYVLKNWEEQGMTRLVISRARENGWVDAGVFLLDVFCLGVKDAFVLEAPAHEWPARLERILPADERVALHPACARKFVEGAVAYAEAIGFAPHRDYNKARRVFSSVNARDCPQTFNYGERGKPHYIAGPHDDSDRIDRVLRTLKAKLGADGFHYTVPRDAASAGEDATFDAAGVREAVRMKFIDRRCEENRHILGGLCAAACVAEPEIQPEDLIPLLWTTPPPAWTSEDDELGDLIAGYWNHTQDRLDSAAERSRPDSIPHFVDEAWNGDSEIRMVASLWCRGFVRAVAAWPSAWGDLCRRPGLEPHFAALTAIAAESYAQNEDTSPAADELPRIIGVAVQAIAAARPASSDEFPS